MQFPRTLALLLSLGAATSTAAAQIQPEFVSQDPAGARPRPSNDQFRWRTGQAMMQGFFGISEMSTVDVGGTVDGDNGDLDQMPVIGGGGQWKLGGDRIDVGLEGMLSFAGRANAEAFVAGGGGAAIAVDVDMLVFDLYGGPFVSKFVGNKLRFYGAAGPMMQFIEYDQTGSSLDADGEGFGSGWYARAGFEFALPSRSFVGMGVRWSDTSVDLGNALGDLEMDGLQVFVSLSYGI